MMMKKNKYTLTTAQQACQQALETCDRCTIIKSIRSGKTLTILDYSAKKNYKKVLWLTPFLVNIESLIDEIEKWQFKLNIVPTTYNSVKHYVNMDFDLVVVDECQRITEDTAKYLQTIICKKLVCMTGTYPKGTEKLKLIEDNLKCQIVFTYSIADAVIDKNVAPYNITIIEKELSKESNILVDTKNHKFYTSEQKSYDYLLKKIISLDSSKRKTLAIFSMMRMLNTLPSTINFVKNYIKQSYSKRVLIFVATQQMAEQCSEYCYYGGKSDKYYNLFREGKINHLVLVEKATIGITYEDLDGCLLTTINSSNSSVLQKIFRTILFRPNYTADIKILINKNTKQVEWIKKALDNI